MYTVLPMFPPPTGNIGFVYFISEGQGYSNYNVHCIHTCVVCVCTSTV